MASDDTLLTMNQLSAICKYGANSSRIGLEYRVLLEAYRAMYLGDYRKAIIESATSAEMALTGGIKRALSEKNVTFGDQLLRKFRMLSGRLELARIVGVTLPNCDFKSHLVDPRNDVIHRAEFASEFRAMNAIKVVDELLSTISPDICEA